MYKCGCGCGFGHISALETRGFEHPGIEVRDSCELSHIGTGNLSPLEKQQMPLMAMPPLYPYNIYGSKLRVIMLLILILR